MFTEFNFLNLFQARFWRRDGGSGAEVGQPMLEMPAQGKLAKTENLFR